MNPFAETLTEVADVLGEVVHEVVDGGAAGRLDDGAVLDLLSRAAQLGRLAEALMIEAVAQVDLRSDTTPADELMTVRHGCRSVNELVQRVTRHSSSTVSDALRAARAIARSTAPSTGELLPARYPQVRCALSSGALGIDGTSAIVRALESAVCSEPACLAADHELAASARGDGADGGPAPSADDLRNQAAIWAMYLDQDGAEPREVRALRKRGLALGVCRDGLVSLRGELLPEVAGQLQRLCDSILNPKSDVATGPCFVEAVDDGEPLPDVADVRTAAQKCHDALATILSAAARSGELPTIGGAAPTLVVEARADDLASGSGFAHIDACAEPVSLAVARQIACTGAVQRVTVDDGGRILAIGIVDRVFAAHQRKAISLRDGGCVIPGCHVSAAWCEIHHVDEAARGGPTHTDNGVLLCWFHHRTIESSGWQVRMNRGVPEVRGPYWWDAAGRWRPTTKSPVRQRSRLRA